MELNVSYLSYNKTGYIWQNNLIGSVFPHQKADFSPFFVFERKRENDRRKLIEN